MKPKTTISLALRVGVFGALTSLALTAVGPAATGTPEPTPPATNATPAPPSPADLAVVDGYPELGKWMIDETGVPAHWLGEVYRGKQIREPINVIIIDAFSTSETDAKKKLVAACTMAGYPARTGHSTGYRGYIAGVFYEQLPEEKRHAFSNGPFELDNNHGRIFGPALIDGKYYFSAAFSRENVDPITKVKHLYASFDRARDNFTQRLDEHTDYKVIGFANLGNALIGDPNVTTGDHDGIAVVVSATR